MNGKMCKGSFTGLFFLSCFQTGLENFIKYNNSTEDSYHFDINSMLGLTCRKSSKFKYYKEHDNFCSYRIRLLKLGCMGGLQQCTCTRTNVHVHSVTNTSLPALLLFLMFLRLAALKHCHFHWMIHTLCLEICIAEAISLFSFVLKI